MTAFEPQKSLGKCAKHNNALDRIRKFREWKKARSQARSEQRFGDGDPPCQDEAVAVLAASEVVDAAKEQYEDALLLEWLAYEAYELCMNNQPQPGPPDPPEPPGP